MKTEVLLRSIGKINDELIADAESEANTKRKPGWAKLGIMVACLALVLCTGIAANAIRSNATAGTFTMDVNPSVEYTIAKSGIVKNVRCLNSDAENALSDVALGKQSVETALTRTVAAYEACGYMENGEATVLISFDSRLDANAELKASLSAEIRKALEQTDAVGTLVFHSELTENAEVAKIAEEFHVSLGRADWILTAANKTGLPTDEVARMSLDELLKFQEASGIVSVSVSKFISLEEAKKIALKDAKLDELTHDMMEEFTLQDVAQSALARLKDKAGRLQVSLQLVDSTGGNSKLLGISSLMEEIFFNLLDNGLKYNHPGGEVTLRLSEGENKYTVSVADTGMGIPGSELPHIFERFYRVDRSRHKAIEGTGLGLSIVKHGVGFHGGSIRVVSTVGQGTEFIMKFPKPKYEAEK